MTLLLLRIVLLRVVLPLLAVLCVPVSAVAQGYVLSKIALSGETAPDSGGATYTATGFFPSTALNAAREVPFVAIVTGGSLTEGVWESSSGVLGSRVLEGQTAPVVPSATYQTFAGILPSVNHTGDVVFAATTSNLDKGVFIDSGGTQSAVVLSAEPLPGTSGGTFFDTRPPGLCCPFAGLAINDADDVAFFARVSGGSVSEGIFTGSAGSLGAAALPGDAAPGPGAEAMPASALGRSFLSTWAARSRSGPK